MLIGNHNVDLSDRLFIDTAFATKVEYQDKNKEMHPYTDCQALEHGWRWRIPTQSRIGTGYCFNRSITDPDIVADSFVKHCRYQFRIHYRHNQPYILLKIHIPLSSRPIQCFLMVL